MNTTLPPPGPIVGDSPYGAPGCVFGRTSRGGCTISMIWSILPPGVIPGCWMVIEFRFHCTCPPNGPACSGGAYAYDIACGASIAGLGTSVGCCPGGNNPIITIFTDGVLPNTGNPPGAEFKDVKKCGDFYILEQSFNWDH